jgi:hypothetical protein
MCILTVKIKEPRKTRLEKLGSLNTQNIKCVTGKKKNKHMNSEKTVSSHIKEEGKRRKPIMVLPTTYFV